MVKFENLCLFDFITKTINITVFINRCKILLQISENSRKLSHAYEIANECNEYVFNYLNLFVVLLDKDLKIVFANVKLIKALGLSKAQKIIGKSWLDFIPEVFKESVKDVHFTLRKGKDEIYNEYTNLIKPKQGECFLVKWLNSCFTKPLSENETTLSIGILMSPLDDSSWSPDSIEEIRNVWKNNLISDKEKVKYLQQLAEKSLIKTSLLHKQFRKDIETLYTTNSKK